MELRLKLAAWQAWAPGLPDPAAWQAAAQGGAPGYSGVAGPAPAVSLMPPALRRRADLNDRIGLELAYRLAPGTGPLPTVWASRHGQVARSAVLLTQLAQGEALSPMDFSLSVHNATAGLFSIARGDRSENTAISAGAEGLWAALLEAQGLILEGAERVLVIDHDSAPPEDYAGRWDPEPGHHGLALLLDAKAGQALSLSATEPSGPATPKPGAGAGPASSLPLAVCLAQRLASGQGESVWQSPGLRLTLSLGA